VGAYVVAVTGLPFLVAVPLGGLAGAAVAVAVGLPALRLQGLTLAVSTLAFALAVTAVLLDGDQLGRFLPETVDRPLLLGVSLEDQRAFYLVALSTLVLSVLAVAGLRRARTGRVLVAARDNEAAAQSFGIGLLRARLTAFALSGFLAAVAGGLYAYQQAQVSANAFPAELSLLVFTWTVIGGLGALAGPLLGFGVLAVVTLVSASPGIVALINGLGGIVLLLLAPGGLAQLVYDARDGLLRRLAQRHGIAVPGLGGVDPTGAAPIRPRTGPSGAEVHVPVRYRLDEQWAASAAARDAADAGREVRT
jgi:branched-chain amino acid transport system permease protein